MIVFRTAIEGRCCNSHVETPTEMKFSFEIPEVRSSG